MVMPLGIFLTSDTRPCWTITKIGGFSAFIVFLSMKWKDQPHRSEAGPDFVGIIAFTNPRFCSRFREFLARFKKPKSSKRDENEFHSRPTRVLDGGTLAQVRHLH